MAEEKSAVYCEYCGPVCYGGACHNARVEAGDKRHPAATLNSRNREEWHKHIDRLFDAALPGEEIPQGALIYGWPGFLNLEDFDWAQRTIAEYVEVRCAEVMKGLPTNHVDFDSVPVHRAEENVRAQPDVPLPEDAPVERRAISGVVKSANPSGTTPIERLLNGKSAAYAGTGTEHPAYDLEEGERLAKGATPQNWWADCEEFTDDGHYEEPRVFGMANDEPYLLFTAAVGHNEVANASYIAYHSPDRILALIERVREAEKALEIALIGWDDDLTAAEQSLQAEREKVVALRAETAVVREKALRDALKAVQATEWHDDAIPAILALIKPTNSA